MGTGRRAWMVFAVLTAVAVLFGTGCGVTNSTKQTNKFNGDAADAGAVDVEALRPHVDPQGVPILMMILRRFKGISAGAKAVEAAIGSPTGAEVYSPANHEKWTVIAVTETERNANMIDAAIDSLESVGTKVGIITGTVALFGAIFGFIKKAREAASKTALLDVAKDKLGEAKDVIGVMVRGVQKSERDGTPPGAAIAEEAGHMDLTREVHVEVLANKDASVVPPAPAPAPAAAPAAKPDSAAVAVLDDPDPAPSRGKTPPE